MEDKKHEQFVDNLLDASLARRRSGEPRAGLEQRVLARLRAEHEPRPWFRWSWRLAAGLAAFAIVVATAHWARRTVLAPGTPTRSSGSPAMETSKAAALTSTLQPDTTKPAASHTARRIMSRSMRHVASQRVMIEPRRSVFPSPVPLSEQERLLVTYAKLSPPPNSLTFHPGDQEIEEIQIEPLEIAPLKTEAAQSENVTN